MTRRLSGSTSERGDAEGFSKTLGSVASGRFARRHMLSILPEPEEREKCLNVFADAIDRANGHSRDNWALTQAKGKVRLIVGSK